MSAPRFVTPPVSGAPAKLPPPWPHTPLGDRLAVDVGPLTESELLKIRTEIQADSARDVFAKASACLAEAWSHDDWPSRIGSLQYFVQALAGELDRTLEREQEWIRIAGYAPVTPPAGESLGPHG